MAGRGLALAVALALAAPAGAQVALDAAGLRTLGFETLAAGDAGRALAYAEALVARDPGDAVALILKARALRATGEFGPAQAAARGAWAAAETPDQRYGAALAMAQALSAAGARTRAQFWLRRAVETAPNPQARDIAVRDFDYVRSRNPLSFSVDLSVAPSSNVNGGSSSRTTEILGLPFILSGESRALSGTEVEASAQLRYRLPITAHGQTEFRLTGQTRQVRLSDAARAAAPEAENGDFAFAALEYGMFHRVRPQGDRIGWGAGLTAGRNWYGGEPLTDYLRLDLSAEKALSPGTLGQVRAFAEMQERHDDARRDATVLGLTAGITQRLANGDRLRFSVGLRETSAEASSVAHSAVSGGIGWEKARPVGAVRIAADLGFETRDYPAFPFAMDGREDFRVSARLSLTFEKVEYMGFSPVLSLTAAETWSTVGLYDSRETAVNVGFSSKF